MVQWPVTFRFYTELLKVLVGMTKPFHVNKIAIISVSVTQNLEVMFSKRWIVRADFNSEFLKMRLVEVKLISKSAYLTVDWLDALNAVTSGFCVQKSLTNSGSHGEWTPAFLPVYI